MRTLRLAIVILLAATGTALGQVQQQPVVVTSTTGTGANVTQPVGNGAGNSTPMPVTVSGSTGTAKTAPAVSASTDISGTVTSGGVYQTVAAANTSRKNCTIQNPTTATEVLDVKLGTMASPYTLAAGATFSSGYGSDAITVTAATTSHAFVGTCQ